MSNPMLSKLSGQAYLHGELTSDIRHEYVDGEVYAMAGTGEAHNLVALNYSLEAARRCAWRIMPRVLRIS